MFIGFAFIYWLGSRSEGPRALPVKVVFNGAVTGLSVGGSVNFNGIKVGDVGSLGFDPKDPSVVIATIRVSPTTRCAPTSRQRWGSRRCPESPMSSCPAGRRHRLCCLIRMPRSRR
ncbi:MAG: MCE family protein [Alphaproteobacteria bacterium]|nr:MCE family protein [Alphaproteobacteria bacterium]